MVATDSSESDRAGKGEGDLATDPGCQVPMTYSEGRGSISRYGRRTEEDVDDERTYNILTDVSPSSGGAPRTPGALEVFAGGARQRHDNWTPYARPPTREATALTGPGLPS